MIPNPLASSHYYGCPACALRYREEEKRCFYLHARLCEQHRRRFIEMLKGTDASQIFIYHWLPFMRRGL